MFETHQNTIEDVKVFQIRSRTGTKVEELNLEGQP